MKILIAVMAVVNAADGIVAPMFAIFVSQKIEGADLTTIGYAVAIYWIAKSILQIPISRYLDRTKGENDDLYKDSTHKIFENREWWYKKLEEHKFKIKDTPEWFMFAPQIVIAEK